MKIRRIFAVLIIVAHSVGAASLVDSLRSNLFSQVWGLVNGNADYPITAAAIDTIRIHLQSDGSFDDVSYSAASSGMAINHVKRLTSMAACYQNSSCPFYRDSTLKSQYYLALSYWTTLNLNDANWYDRYIGYPMYQWCGVVLMDSISALDRPALRDSVVNYLLWAWKSGSADYKTGANLANILNIAMPVSILQQDTAAIRIEIDSLNNDLNFAAVDGLKPDGIYTFHSSNGLQMYNGGYGYMFAMSVGQIMAFTGGTSMAFGGAALDQMNLLVLDGSRWLSYGEYMDYNAIGRHISSPNQHEGSSYQSIVKNLLGAGSSRTSELNAYYNESKNNIPNALTGNRLFWSTDFMLQRTPNWYVSARATSTRTVGNESGNGEGLKDYHLADGVLMHFVDGREYYNIFPTWNWDRIPGATIAQNNIFPSITWGSGDTGGSAFAGGVSDSSIGLLAMVQDRDSVSAKKAWFFNSQGVLALGANINSTSNAPLITTVEQDLHSGFVIFKSGTHLAMADSSSFIGGIWHRRTSYLFLDSTSPWAILQAQSGEWYNIDNGYSTANVTDTVLQIGYNHGIKPQGVHYAYQLRLNTDSTDLQKPSEWKILQNNDTIQAAQDSLTGNVYAVFYRKGSLAIQGGSIGCDSACTLLFEIKNNQAFLRVNLPSRSSSSLPVRIQTQLTSKDSLVNVILPSGNSAGSDASLTLTWSNATDVLHSDPMVPQYHWNGNELVFSGDQGIVQVGLVNVSGQIQWIDRNSDQSSLNVPERSQVQWVILQDLQGNRWEISRP